MAFAAGQTAIIVPVDAAEPIVGRWRRQFDPSAAAGVPAHVTIIYPFLPEQNLDGDVLRDVRRLVAHHPSFTVTFAHCGRSPTSCSSSPTPMTRSAVLPPTCSSTGQTPRRTAA